MFQSATATKQLGYWKYLYRYMLVLKQRRCPLCAKYAKINSSLAGGDVCGKCFRSNSAVTVLISVEEAMDQVGRSFGSLFFSFLFFLFQNPGIYLIKIFSTHSSQKISLKLAFEQVMVGERTRENIFEKLKVRILPLMLECVICQVVHCVT